MSYEMVAQRSSIGSDEAIMVEVDGKEIALLECDGVVHAFSNVCTHEYAQLHEGFVEGCFIECPLHGSQFDVRTGSVKSLPATKDLPTYPVKIEGEDVLVDIHDEGGN